MFLPASLMLTYMLVTMPEARRSGLGWGVAGGWGGLFVCAKIVLTGTSTRFLERPAIGQQRAQEDSTIEPPTA